MTIDQVQKLPGLRNQRRAGFDMTPTLSFWYNERGADAEVESSDTSIDLMHTVRRQRQN